MKISNLEIKDHILANMAIYYRIRTIYLFGQILSDTAPSDCDVEVLVEFFPDNYTTEYDLLEFKGLLEELFNRTIDLYRKDEIEDKERLKEILRMARKVYVA